MQFDATETLGALAKLPPETPKPVEPSTTAGGIWRAARNAVPAAVAESAAMVAKVASASFDDSPDNRGPVRQFGEEVERSLRNVAESYAPDPMTASKAEQVVFGLTRGVGKAVGYGLTTGPAAPLLFGVDEGLTEREKLLRQGVDEATAGKVGMVAGVVNAAGFAIPAAGSTVAKTIGLATLSGPASFVAQQAGSREILRAADYESIASSYDPTDALGLALSAIPFGFGAWAMRGRLSSKSGTLSSKPDALSSKPEAKPAVVNESLTTQPPPDAIPVEPMRAADEAGAVIPLEQAPARAEAAPFTPEPIVRQEHVDAAMVKNLVDFEDGVKANPPEKFEAELWRGPVTENPNFKAWFGESKVVDPSGAPMIVYHGTSYDVPEFAIADLSGLNLGDTSEGFAFFTNKANAYPDSASDYAVKLESGPNVQPNVVPVYVALKNPLILDASGKYNAVSRFDSDAKAIREAVSAGGHDGVIIKYLDGSSSEVLIAATRPEQIKSAIGNSGRFDPTSPSLTDPIPPKETPADVPTPAKLGEETREAPAAQREAQAGDIPAGTGPEAAVIQSVRTRADQVVLEAPDLVVGVDENGATITAKEALEKIRREAQEGTENELGAADAPLLDVAVQCALSVGQ